MARGQRVLASGPGQPTWVIAVLLSMLMIAMFGLGYVAALYMLRSQQESPEVAVASAASVPASVDPCPTSTPLIGDGLPVKDAVVLNVFNATAKQGLAAQAALDFKREGFRILSIANDPRNADVVGVGEIRFGPGARKAAKLVEYYLAGAKMVELKRDDTVVDVALGPAYTQLADGDAVASFLAEPAASDPACTASASPSSPAAPTAPTAPSGSSAPSESSGLSISSSAAASQRPSG